MKQAAQSTRTRTGPFPETAEDVRCARMALRQYTRSLPCVSAGETWFAELSLDQDVVLLPGTRLPAGVQFGSECRALYGTPSEIGAFWVEFEERPSGRRRLWSFDVVPVRALEIARTRLPAMRCGEPVQVEFELTEPREDAAWFVTHGRLPPGLRLDARSGTLSGIPSQAGVWCCAVGVAVGTRRALASASFVVELQPAQAVPTLLHRVLLQRRAERTRAATPLPRPG